MFRDKAKDGTTRLTGSPLAAWPVGSVYISMTPTDPGTIFGGTWARLAKGQVLVGVDENDTDFNTARKTGGEKKHILTTPEMPLHNHGGLTGNDNQDHSHAQYVTANPGVGNVNGRRDWVADANGLQIYPQGNNTGGRSNAHNHNIPGDGSSQGHNNLQPFCTAYIWERTA